MSKYYNVKTTIDDPAIASKITKNLLEKRLVSSVQRREVSSTWWWHHKLEEAKEYVLEMKTRKELFPQVEQEIKKFHSYEVPEIFAEEIKEAPNDYVNWIEKETTSEKNEPIKRRIP